MDQTRKLLRDTKKKTDMRKITLQSISLKYCKIPRLTSSTEFQLISKQNGFFLNETQLADFKLHRKEEMLKNSYGNLITEN
jgi:hypothetical protein